MRNLVTYQLQSPLIRHELRFALVSDLHNEPYDDILPMLNGCSALLIPGDITNRYRKEYQNGLSFVRESAKRLPVLFSPGNHDMCLQEQQDFLKSVSQCGAEVLFNRSVAFSDIWIGGYYQPENAEQPAIFPSNADKRFRMLLCHKPEWVPLLPQNTADLFLCGHAHGGQIRIGRQGLYAPGQGLLPAFTNGWYRQQRMLVSTGAGNPVHMPRWGNGLEAIRLILSPASEEKLLMNGKEVL